MWFDELPAVLSDLAKRWQIELGAFIPRGSMSVVIHCQMADGRRAAPVDEEGGAIGVVADPAGTLVVTLRRGFGGERLDGLLPGPEGSGTGGSRPLQCSVEPGQSPRNDARP